MMRRDEDQALTRLYEENGLFAKIIDAPAEEAFRPGFSIVGSVPGEIVEAAVDLLEWLHWDEKAAEAVKWTRLFGGALVVMLINDGGRIEEPLRMEKVRSVDGLMVYDRSIVRPSTVEVSDGSYPMPEYYQVFSRYGTFTIHESRCLIFRNGELLERSPSWHLWPWGIPEAYRVLDALKGAEISHGSAVRLLDKSVQPVYKLHELSKILETLEGEAQVLRRLDTMDISRGIFKTVPLSMDDDFSYLGEVPEGIGKVIDISDRMLSAATGIPETVLFGKPIDYERPGRMWRRGDDVSMGNWYSLVQGIQSGMIKNNLWRLLYIIFQAETNSGELTRLPKFDVEFSPLWFVDDMERAEIEFSNAEKQKAEAQAAALYVRMGAMAPREVRRRLRKDKDQKRKLKP